MVVFARDDPGACARAVASLLAQDRIGSAEILVADGSGGDELGSLEGCAVVRRLRLPPASMPRLKAVAILASRAPIVAILDPNDVALPGWLAAILDHFPRDPRVAGVGGSVEPGRSRHMGDRGAYLFEYGCFAPPIRPGPTLGDLPGNNVAYRRSALVGDCGDLLEGGFWKPFFHERLRALGHSLALLPQMRVRHETDHRFGAFLRSRFHFGRCFGAMRARRASFARRWTYRALAPLVPLVVAAKQLGRALRHPVRRRALARAALPLLGICVGWGVGEWLGYWAGAAKSCDRVH